eukprot:TRINITY_DN8496_c0_g1_i1.p1 TRINITY_DN8496_c0_g1~~TRINITY_DN8496_c0_g1_i1.p1  ORF type:complete len:193 (+),score=33.03 TRINITY_DN8496_c0_g1_i1:67-645(+)
MNSARRPNPTPPLVLPPIRDSGGPSTDPLPVERQQISQRTPRSRQGSRFSTRGASPRMSSGNVTDSPRLSSPSPTSRLQTAPQSTTTRPNTGDSLNYGDVLNQWRPAMATAREIQTATKESKRLREELQTPRSNLHSIEQDLAKQKSVLQTEIELLKAETQTPVLKTDRFKGLGFLPQNMRTHDPMTQIGTY